MKPIQVPHREKKPSLNAIYGLNYRMIAVKAEDVAKLHDLKVATNQPMTVLLSLAIDHFLKSAEPETK